MTTTSFSQSARLARFADTAMKATAKLWLSVALIGQGAFLLYLVAFYVPSSLSGNFQVWSKNSMLKGGYVPGDTAGNLSFAAHALLASIIVFGGAIQLIPKLRARAIALHRWNGRLFFVTALCLSLTGLYMVWVRGTRGGWLDGVAVSLNAVLIMACCGMAWFKARQRDIASHQRWALRAYLVSNAQWFTRVGLFAWIMLNGGPVGMGTNFDGPVVVFWSFGCYLVPLAVLELYLRMKQGGGPKRKLAVASTLVVFSVLTGVGTAGVAMSNWVPAVKAAYDPRISIADTLAATIASQGIEPAIQQYYALKASSPKTYNFDQRELNRLGYKLMGKTQYKEATAILQLNVQAFPNSANAYDSLAEAYAKDGNREQAIANYKMVLKIKPDNQDAAKELAKLLAR